jgi:cyclopropane fatty-acyl-phospholipid synthase-like methyltransferase
MTDFDRHADKYADILDRCVRFTGEGTRYWAERKAEYLVRLLGAGFQGRTLDYGCGVGMLSRALVEHLPDVRLDGYDVSEESLRKLEPGLASRGTFTTDVGKLGADYDLIVAANVLHHVEPARRPATFAALKDRLRPGGRLAVFEHNPFNPVTRWIVSECEFDKDAILLPLRETADRMKASGLEVRRRDYITFFPGFMSGLRGLESLLAWCPLGAQYAVLGCRPES